MGCADETCSCGLRKSDDIGPCAPAPITCRQQPGREIGGVSSPRGHIGLSADAHARSRHQSHEWLVLARDEQIIGFAYGQPLKRLAAFQSSVEAGIYVDIAHHRAGGGREIYTQLLRRLTERGYRHVFAGITQPNEASNGFHRSFGFQDADLYRRVAWKHNGWRDVAWMQLDLLDTGGPDGPPGPIR
jgi:L-amino acid N-acyltransferase YncA